MDYRKWLVLGLCFIMVGGFALAADTTTMDRQATTPMTETGKMGAMQSGQIQANRLADLLDKDVRSMDDQKVGELRDILLDQGRLAFGVLDYKGQLHAIPWQAFQIQPKGEKDYNVSLNIDKAKLDAHKGFEKNQWPTMDQNWKRQQYQDFGMTEPMAMGTSRMNGVAGRSTTGNETTPGMAGRSTTGTETTPGMAGRSTTGTGEAATMGPVAMHRLSEVLGSKVRVQGADVGNLEDVVAESRGNHVLFGIVSLEGKGIIEKIERNQLAVVPWEKISVDRAGEVTANVDRTKLMAATFSHDKMPDFNDRAYVASIYQRYDVKPYWETYGYEGESRDMMKDTMDKGRDTLQKGTDTMQKGAKDTYEKGQQQMDKMNNTLND